MERRKALDSGIGNRVYGYLQGRPEVIAAYLFGSYASGRTNPESDVDIAILHDPKTLSKDGFTLKMEYLRGLEKIFHRNVDIVLLQEAGMFLRYQVFKKGVRIYEGDRRRATAFQSLSLQEYFDFRFQEKIYYGKVLNRLRGTLRG